MKKHAENNSSVAVSPANAHQPTMAHYAKDKASASLAYHTEVEKTSRASRSVVAVIPHRSKSASPVVLTTCQSVSYEMRDCVPGVKYINNTTEPWTPVMKRSGRKKKPDQVFDPVDSSSDTSGSDVSCSRTVHYSLREGVPGMSIHRRCLLFVTAVVSRMKMIATALQSA